MSEKAEFAERLKQAMIAAGYEPRSSVLEREFNQRFWGRSVTFQAARQWLRGDTLPQQEKLQVLAEWLNVEPHVLRYGEQVSTRVKAKQKRWDEGIGYQEREVFEAFLKLPVAQRKVVREVILAFVKADAAGVK